MCKTGEIILKKIKGTPYMPKSKSQTHLTPDRVYDIIEANWNVSKIDLHDPCPPYTPYKSPIFFNGLYGNWEEYNYVNPPFEVKTLTQFVEKAIQQKKKGKTSFMLLPVKSDQDWWHDHMVPILYETPRNVLWIKRRLHFKNDKDSAQASHFLVMIK